LNASARNTQAMRKAKISSVKRVTKWTMKTPSKASNIKMKNNIQMAT